MEVGSLAELIARVEQPRASAPLGPAAVSRERGLMDVTAQHDVRGVSVEQAGQLRVAVVPRAGPRERAFGWAVERPRPMSRPVRRGGVEPFFERGQRLRALPPRARGHSPALEVEGVAVDDNPVVARLGEPACELLAGVGTAVEIVVARAHHRRHASGEAFEIVEHHRDLRIERHGRRDVEQVAREDGDVDRCGGIGGAREHPVELAEVVVKVGDEQDAHARQSCSQPRASFPTPPQALTGAPAAVAGACFTSASVNARVQQANSSRVPFGSWKYIERTNTSPLSVAGS